MEQTSQTAKYDGLEGIEEAEIALKVQEAQIYQLYRQTWGGLAGTLFIAVSVCIILWRVFPQWQLIAWLCCLVVLTIARGFLNAAFQRKSPSAPEIFIWAKWQVAGVVASGFLWSLPSLLLWPESSPVHQMVWPICLAALSASAIAHYYIWPPSSLSFLLLVMVPISLRLLLEGEMLSMMLGFLGLVFIAILNQAASKIHKTSLRAFSLSLRNEALNLFLAEGKMKLEELNAQLHGERAERTRSQEQLRLLSAQLTQAQGALPICVACKKIGNDSEY